uniref:Putative ovule protein n=1 Tax=Solanum chacoense TaxID=4108 RepID=A0A0V0IXE7_SOLCH
MENQLKNIQTLNEQLRKEKSQVKVKLKMYLENFKQFKSRVALQQEEAAKYCAVDVSVIQKMVEDLEAEDNDVVEVNSKVSAAVGDFHEMHLC